MYYPHLTIKDKSWIDMVEFTGKLETALYVLECGVGMELNIMPNPDWVTGSTDGWTGRQTVTSQSPLQGDCLVTSTCTTNTGDQFGLAEGDLAPGENL